MRRWGDLGKEALGQVEPGSPFGGQVQVAAGTPRKPLAWIWLFSPRLTTRALGGGFRYSSALSSSFSKNSGSLLSLKLFTRCDCKPCLRHAQHTVAGLTFWATFEGRRQLTQKPAAIAPVAELLSSFCQPGQETALHGAPVYRKIAPSSWI